MRKTIIIGIVLYHTAAAFAATVHVPLDYPTIQGAIDAASDGDVVLVAAGTYAENIDFNGKAITLTSEDGPQLSIIDGLEAGSVVTFESGEGEGSVLERFTICNGKSPLGGGIFCGGSAPLITNNVITQNMSPRGSGICCKDGSSPSIKDNLIVENGPPWD